MILVYIGVTSSLYFIGCVVSFFLLFFVPNPLLSLFVLLFFWPILNPVQWGTTQSPEKRYFTAKRDNKPIILIGQRSKKVSDDQSNASPGWCNFCQLDKSAFFLIKFDYLISNFFPACYWWVIPWFICELVIFFKDYKLHSPYGLVKSYSSLKKIPVITNCTGNHVKLPRQIHFVVPPKQNYKILGNFIGKVQFYTCTILARKPANPCSLR